jgi:hypothetical protein
MRILHRTNFPYERQAHPTAYANIKRTQSHSAGMREYEKDTHSRRHLVKSCKSINSSPFARLDI